MHFSLLSKQLGKSYHRQRHLLIQFILAELLAAHTEIKQLKKNLAHSEIDIQINALFEPMVKLAGSSQGYMRLLAWSDDGILAKLKNYCAFMCQQGEMSDKSHNKMHRDANQAWLLSLQLLDTFHLMQQEGSTEDVSLLQSPFDKLNVAVERLAKSVAKVLNVFQADENVIFFLLRNRVEMDELFGQHFTFNLVKKMIPKGTKSVGEFLISKYSERGFYYLVPLIEEHAKSL